MGNRAVIATSDIATSPAIYLHWNGDPESVLAFLHAAKELGFRDPTMDAAYGTAYLQALICMFFGGGESTGISALQNSDTDNGDNGVYRLGPGWTIRSRMHAPANDKATTVDELSPDMLKKYVDLKARVIRQWRASQDAKKES